MWIAMMVAVGFFPLMPATLMSRSNLANSSISVMETLAFASFHRNSETLHLQGCGTALHSQG